MIVEERGFKCSAELFVISVSIFALLMFGIVKSYESFSFKQHQKKIASQNKANFELIKNKEKKNEH